MKLLLKNATLLDEKSPFHNQKKDVFIQEGILTAIEDSIPEAADTVVEIQDLHLSSGWFDPCVSFGEPGYEERETLDNGLQTAAKSGFTHIVLNPNTHPVLDTYSVINHLRNATQHHTTFLHISASLSERGEGKQMASLADLNKAGACAFGDFNTAIDNPNLLRIALDYVQNFNGLIQAYPVDTTLYSKGQMHEGLVSTTLGLKGIPAIAETAILARDLQLLEYTQGKMHIPFISCAESVQLVRDAKKRGLNVSAAVGLAHLLFNDEQLTDFDARFKIRPPLRSSADQRALREGLLDGTIDMVTTLHQPLNPEIKNLEFVSAAEGSIGLEAAFGALLTIFPLEKVVSFLSRGKNRFGIQSKGIAIGQEADLSLFTPKGNWTLQVENLYSASTNCLFVGHQQKGKVLGCVRKNHLQLNQ